MGLLKLLCEKYPFEVHEAGITESWGSIVEEWRTVVIEHPLDHTRVDTDKEYTTVLGDKVTWGLTRGIIINGKWLKA